MNKAYIAILSALGASVIKSGMSGSLSKRKHPSSIFGGYEGIFKKRMHWDKDASAEDRRKYDTQPKYYGEMLQNIDDKKLVEKLQQLFREDSKARNVFQTIVSDFYLRPKYWMDILHSTLYRVSLFEDVPLSQKTLSFDTDKINPTVVSQFFPQDEVEKTQKLTVMSYSVDAFRRRRNKKADLYELFGRTDMFELAKKFYSEYIVGQTTDLDGFRFWLMILHSVVCDLADRTTYESLQKAVSDRDKWYRANMKRVENTVKAFLSSAENLLTSIDIQIEIDQKPVMISQRTYLDKSEIQSIKKASPKKIAQSILADALDNWVFSIKVLYADGTENIVPISSVQYIPNIFRVKSGQRMMIDKRNQSTLLGQNWVERFVNGDSFMTLLSRVKKGELTYSPVEMSLGKPTANIIIKRTNKKEAEEWIRKTHNTLPKFPKNGLLDIIGAYNFENRLMGIMVLNTPPHVASKLEDAPGQYHIIDISRIAVSNTDSGRRIAVLLTEWAIKNKEFYNRSAWKGNANVVTYSMLQESGRTYEAAGMNPTRLSLPGSKHERTDDMISGTWKIRWESNPYMNISPKVKLPKVKNWLPKLHRAYVKITQCHTWDYQNNCWKKLNKNQVKLDKSDIQGLINGSPDKVREDYVAFADLVRVCGFKWQDALKDNKIEYPKNSGNYRNMIYFRDNGISLVIFKDLIIRWINKQKISCPNKKDLLLPEYKLCRSKK